ncbi:axoneme-associated protein mst101(2)-like [Palaemon carinicauda]|uniref:axoneme-associated protein mst101(2)-like n=1 Tax=Palaemon carinicauda TaxID=392227 RepID=UPI0035B69385
MRTWVLLLFCVVVIAAVANAQKQGNGAGKEDREKGKKVEGKEVKKDGKINRQKSNGNGNRERNKLEKANNRERNSKKNEGKDGKGPQKAKDRTIKNKSERDPKNKRPRNGGKVQNKPKKVGDRNKSLKKKEDKSSKQLKKTKSKQDCPGECVAEGDCQGRSKRGMMCDDDQVCCLPKRNRAVKKGTSVKRFCKPLSLCSDMEGECRKKKQGCNLDEKRYKNKKNKAYCDKKSCYCCVKQCKSRGKCLKQGGTCMLKKASKKLCAGDFVMGKNYCDGKKCGCCIPGGPSPSCKQKKTCTKEGGECVPLGSSCSGEIKTVNSNGKNYCKGSCGCCLEGKSKRRLHILYL